MNTANQTSPDAGPENGPAAKDPNHLSMAELETGLDSIRQSPKEEGILAFIVCRPATNERKVLKSAELHLADGLLGDSWKERGSARTVDGSANPEMQLNVMNARAISLVARHKERWQLAGDQLYIDMDISQENLPPGSQLTIGSAVIEITPPPHTGCKKFQARFGADATSFVNSPEGRQLRLRGLNARIIKPGTIRVGDVARKLRTPAT